eukprot:6085090-Pleurochrysis_carterae.AAC.3
MGTSQMQAAAPEPRLAAPPNLSDVKTPQLHAFVEAGRKGPAARRRPCETVANARKLGSTTPPRSLA